MGCKEKNIDIRAYRGVCLAREKLDYPAYKTCGLNNPYYKNSNFYYSAALNRNLNSCVVEDYWTKYLSQAISFNPRESLRGYYNVIVLYIKSVYIYLTLQDKLYYSNLSRECSAILLIKRALTNLVGEEEALRIVTLLKLNINCDCD